MAQAHPQARRGWMSEMPLAPGGAPLADAGWLRTNHSHPDLIVLDARIGPQVPGAEGALYTSGAASFERDGHIPGARFVDLCTEFSDPSARFPFTRPKAETLREVAQRIGINERSALVVYDSLSGAWAARAWWVLRAYGHSNVHVLDGGLAAWQAAGGQLEFGPSAVAARGDFQPVARAGYFVDTPEVLAALEGPTDVPLICASRASEYTGEGSDDVRRGHIPRSYSVPYRELLDVRGRLQLDHVKCEALRLGLDKKVESILYCGGGVNAAGLALGLIAAGYPAVQVYDGSLNEWRADASLPLEIGPEAT
jgi:thiosulfate/3-mercaptopyruvate sulfurtransferase